MSSSSLTLRAPYVSHPELEACHVAGADMPMRALTLRILLIFGEQMQYLYSYFEYLENESEMVLHFGRRSSVLLPYEVVGIDQRHVHVSQATTLFYWSSIDSLPNPPPRCNPPLENGESQRT